MKTNSDQMSNNNYIILNILSWMFGLIVIFIGGINTLWGNDPGFGIFVMLTAFVYFPPLTKNLRKRNGLKIPRFVKVVLGVFIIWAVLGVGELFDKIQLMTRDLSL